MHKVFENPRKSRPDALVCHDSCEYFSYLGRVRSFRNKWDVDFIKPRDLAETGLFFYGKNGSDSLAKCHVCGIILCGWEQGDKPYIEHMKWSPNCPFAQQVYDNHANTRFSSQRFVRAEDVQMTNPRTGGRVVFDAVEEEPQPPQQQQTVCETSSMFTDLKQKVSKYLTPGNVLRYTTAAYAVKRDLQDEKMSPLTKALSIALTGVLAYKYTSRYDDSGEILQDGDVESNPGPVFSKFAVEKQVKKMNAHEQRMVERRRSNTRKQHNLARDAKRGVLQGNFIENSSNLFRGIIEQLKNFFSKHCVAITASSYLVNSSVGAAVSTLSFAAKTSKVVDNCTAITDMLVRMLRIPIAIIETIKKLIQYVVDFCTNSFGFIKEHKALVSLIFLTFIHIKYSIPIAPILIIWCYVFMSKRHQVMDLVTFIYNRFVGDQARGTVQSFDFGMFDAKTMATCVLSVVSFAAIEKLPNERSIDNFLKRLDSIPKAASGTKKIIEWISEFVSKLGDTVKEYTGISLFEKESGIPEEIREFIDKVNELNRKDVLKSLPVNPEVAQEIEDLYHKLSVWRTSFDFRTRNTPEVVQALNMASLLLTPMYTAVMGVAGEAKFRKSPFILFIAGPPGSGKSHITSAAANVVWRRIRSLETEVPIDKVDCKEYVNHLYSRAAETEYWDNYAGQDIVLMDDFGQKRDTVSGGNPEFFDLIRMDNNVPVQVHCAAVTEKGRYFSSKAVIMTSNLYHNLSKFIVSCNDPDAVVRRIAKNAYMCTTHPDYMFTGNNLETVDTDKVKECKPCKEEKWSKEFLATFGICPHAQQFHRYDPVDGKPLTSKMDVAEFLKHIDSEVQKHVAKETNVLEIRQRSLDSKQVTNLLGIQMNLFPEIEDTFVTKEDMQEEEAKISGNVLIERETELINMATHYLAFCKKYEINTFLRESVSAYQVYLELTSRDKFSLMCSFLEYVSFFYGLDINDSRVLDNWIDFVHNGNIPKPSEPLFRSIFQPKKMWAKIQDFFSSFLDKCKDLFSQLCNKIMENPVVAGIVAGAAFLTSVGFAMYLFSDEEDESEEEGVVESCSGEKRNRKSVESLSGEKKNKKSIESMSGEKKNRKAIESLSGEKKEKKTLESLSGEKKTKKNIESLSGEKKIAKTIESEQGTLEMIVDKTGTDIEEKILGTGIVSIMSEKNGVPYKVINAMCIGGNNLLVNRHFVEIYASRYREEGKNKTFFLRNLQRNNFATFQSSDLEANSVFLHKSVRGQRVNQTYAYHDAALFFLDPKKTNMNIAPDLIRYFITQSDVPSLDSLINGRIIILEHQQKGDFMWRNCENFKDLQRIQAKTEFWTSPVELSKKEIVTYVADLKGTYGSKAGDCGSPILWVNKMAESRRIVGVHQAAHEQRVGSMNVNVGRVTLVTQEMLREAIDELALKVNNSRVRCQMDYDLEHVQYDPSDIDAPDRIHSVPLGKGLAILGKHKLRVKGAKNTKLTESPINGVGECIPKCKPAYLGKVNVNGEVIDPMYKGVLKYTKVTTHIDRELLQDVEEDVYENLIHSTYLDSDISQYQEVLSYEESVTGRDSFQYFDGLNRSTSMGFPWTNTHPNLHGKKECFGSDEYLFDTPLAKEVRESHDELIENAKKGVLKNVYWADTLKDEKRPIAKVDAGKTRVFTVGPVQYTIAFRRYFLGFSAWIMTNRIDNGIAVGTNVYSEDWDRIARRLLEVDNDRARFIAGDFENYDGSLNAMILWSILDNINKFYRNSPNWKQEDDDIRTVLWSQVVNSVHVNGDIVYALNHSLPSGCPMTAIANSIYGLYIARLAYLKSMEISGAPKELHSLRSYRENVREIVYGDDNIISFAPELDSYFNQEIITQAFASIGHVYTDEAKSGVQYKHRTLNEISFLKRSFVMDYTLNRFIAPITTDTINEVVLWSKKDARYMSIFEGNLLNALREMSLYPKDEFEKFQNKLREALKLSKCGVSLPPVVYRELREEVVNCKDPFAFIIC